MAKKTDNQNVLQEEIVKLQKQLESFKASNDHFLKNKLFLHYDIKEPEKVIVECETKLPVLTELDKKKIQKGKESDPTHLIIEGDNYHALSVLNYTHAGKIDLIYIDPPYNTGSKDFIYNDRFVDREDSFRHSKWLSFMSHRLRLAKNLLAETGVMFISIDDNEQAHLRLLCDQILDEGNFHGTLTWINKTKPVNSGKAKYQIQQNLEYIFVYSKKKKQDYDGFDLMQKGERKYPHSDKEGVYRLIDIEDSDRGRKKRDTMKFRILGIKPGIGKRWKIGEEEIINLIQNNRIVNIEGKIKRKIYKNEESGFVENPFWSHLIDVATAEDGKKELSGIVGPDHGFDTVKPLSLIEDILSHFENNISILDFFAGSGTTGHAVLKLNAEEKADAIKKGKNPNTVGNRQFILCSTNDEKEPIVDKLTYPRIKKVIDGYGHSAPIQTNLRYFQTDFVEKGKNNDETRADLVARAVDMINVREATFGKVETKNGYVLSRSATTFTAIIFDSFKLADIWNEIEKNNTSKLPVKLYIFSFSEDTSAFTDMIPKTTKLDWESKSIPEGILQVYQRLFKKIDK